MDLAGEVCTAYLCSVAINGSPWKYASEFVNSGKAGSPLLRFQFWPLGDAAAPDGIGRTGVPVWGSVCRRDARGLFLPSLG